MHPDTGWTPAQAMEAGNAVHTLIDHPGWEIVMGLIEKARTDAMDLLISGRRVLDQADYAQQLAFLKGMRAAADAAATVMEASERAVRRAREDAALEAAAG